MVDSPDRARKRGAVPIAELVARVLDPVTAKRGFGTAELIAAWPDIAGSRFAALTRPVKIAWPRGAANEGAAGVLTLNVSGPSAVLVQHELGQILERVNAFLGYQAVERIRLVQAPLGDKAGRAHGAAARPLRAEEEARLRAVTDAVGDDALRDALVRLGRGVLASNSGGTGRGRQTP